MDDQYRYLLIDCFTILFPFLLSFDKKVAYYKQWKHVFVGMLVGGITVVVWDVFFTQWGVWSFNPQYITGIHLGILPVEEWLFFVVVPYSCLFIYECLIRYFPFQNNISLGYKILLPVGWLLLIIGVLNYDKTYTLWAFGISGLFCQLIVLLKRHYTTLKINAFLIAYLISMLPFLVMNGMLTSLPIVQYDDAQNLGIRIYTIPLEDTFYGLVLMLGNVMGMEWSRSRSVKRSPVL